MHSYKTQEEQQAEQDLRSGLDFYRLRESEEEENEAELNNEINEENPDRNADYLTNEQFLENEKAEPDTQGDETQQTAQIKKKRKKRRNNRRISRLNLNAIDSADEQLQIDPSDDYDTVSKPDVKLLMQFIMEQRSEKEQEDIGTSLYVPAATKHQRKLALFDNGKSNKNTRTRFTLYSTGMEVQMVEELYQISTEESFWLSLLHESQNQNSDDKKKQRTWWLDCASVNEAEMNVLSKVFALHPLTQEDISQEEPREKIELFRHYYLVSFRSFDQDVYSPTYLEPLNMYVVVFKEGLLSFHSHPTPHSANVRRRIKHLRDFISVSSDWISYALIDDITDAFGPLIQSIEYEVDSIDELVMILEEVQHTDMLKRIGTCRKKVMSLLRLMSNKADVVKGLAKRCNASWSVAPKSDIGLYLSDIQDHLLTMTQNLNHYELILSRSHTNYLAHISIDMSKANNQINKVLSRVTIIGTILVPMNLVTGLFGMNVKIPGLVSEVDNLNWFIGILVTILAVAALAGLFAWKFTKR